MTVWAREAEKNERISYPRVNKERTPSHRDQRFEKLSNYKMFTFDVTNRFFFVDLTALHVSSSSNPLLLKGEDFFNFQNQI